MIRRLARSITPLVNFALPMSVKLLLDRLNERTLGLMDLTVGFKSRTLSPKKKKNVVLGAPSVYIYIYMRWKVNAVLDG